MLHFSDDGLSELVQRKHRQGEQCCGREEQQEVDWPEVKDQLDAWRVGEADAEEDLCRDPCEDVRVKAGGEEALVPELAHDDVGDLHHHHGGVVGRLRELECIRRVADGRVRGEAPGVALALSPAERLLPLLGACVALHEHVAQVEFAIHVGEPVHVVSCGRLRAVAAVQGGVAEVEGCAVEGVEPVRGRPRVRCLLDNSDERAGLEAVEVHDCEERHHPCGGLEEAPDHVGPDDNLEGAEVLVLLAWRAPHQPRLRVFVAEGDGGKHVAADVHAEVLDAGNGDGDVQNHGERVGHDRGDVGRQDVDHHLLQVVEDAPALQHALGNQRKVVVHEHHVRRVLRRPGPRQAQRHADIRLLEGGRRIHVRAHDAHRVTHHLARLHDLQLLVRRDVRENYVGLLQPQRQRSLQEVPVQLLVQLPLLAQLVARYHHSAALRKRLLREQDVPARLVLVDQLVLHLGVQRKNVHHPRDAHGCLDLLVRGHDELKLDRGRRGGSTPGGRVRWHACVLACTRVLECVCVCWNEHVCAGVHVCFGMSRCVLARARGSPRGRLP